MKRKSPYLNPFQPFPERYGDGSNDRPGAAIEDNLSRSVFSALSNANDPQVLAKFVKQIAQGDSNSTVLRKRMESLSQSLGNSDASKTECGLQTWPAAAMRERDSLEVVLIGISSSHHAKWTHDQRRAPTEPRPDAWIYVPGEFLLVFECKNDEHPLDATQISAYAHHLGLLTEKDGAPRAEPDHTLASNAEAQAVQDACADLVLDANWDTVVKALEHIQQDDEVASLDRWLCGQAASYVQSHVYPPYRGIQTVLKWLNGPDIPDRSHHLRRLVREMGNTLAEPGLPGDITFTIDEDKRIDLSRGAGSAVYVRLFTDGKPLQRDWLSSKVDAVLWFSFSEDDGAQRIGLEFYLQARGAQASSQNATAWNEASARHSKCALAFEGLVEEWSRAASPSSVVEVVTVRFRGQQKMWQGGGIYDASGPTSSPVCPQDAFRFLQERRDELWRFPRVGSGEEFSTIEEAALHVRKPAISWIAPLDEEELGECGDDGQAAQKVLQKAVASMITKSSS